AKARLEAAAKAAGCKWCERPEFQAAIAALRAQNPIYEIGRILHPEIDHYQFVTCPAHDGTEEERRRKHRQADEV
ncbi:MAG TPA: hypothetical protein VEH53_07400, partial [archaeon]|nr:hypothetical protein [archaeon]